MYFNISSHIFILDISYSNFLMLQILWYIIKFYNIVIILLIFYLYFLNIFFASTCSQTALHIIVFLYRKLSTFFCIVTYESLWREKGKSIISISILQACAAHALNLENRFQKSCGQNLSTVDNTCSSSRYEPTGSDISAIYCLFFSSHYVMNTLSTTRFLLINWIFTEIL